MKKARTCFRCKASFHSDGLYYCSLNYKIDTATGTPKEPCPKPLSNPKLVKADKAQCHFAENDKQALIALLEPREKTKILCHSELNGIWLCNEDFTTELRLLLLGNIRLTISRVCFQNQRQGTMTAVIEYLYDFCRQHDIRTILIQSVLTKEMVSWCCKNEFRPSLTSSFTNNQGIILGDYEKTIRKESV